MFKVRLKLRKVAIGIACLAVTSMFFSCEKQSSNKQITAFGFTVPPAVGVINEGAKSIAVEVPLGTDVSALVPAITISDKAMISPTSGVTQNFTNPVTYTVTAEDGSAANYVVTVTIGGGSLQPVELISPITADRTLKDLGLPIDYFFNGSALEVKNNAILTIEDSVTIQFRKTDGSLVITDGATLKALGTDGKRVQFIGASTNKGSWKGIVIQTENANELKYVDILNAGSQNYDYSAALYLDNGKAAVSNSTISGSSSNGITIVGRSGNYKGELTTCNNNTISNCNKAPIITTSYMGCYALRNMDNTNTFTGNTEEYIHIQESMNTYIQGDMTLHSLNGYPWYFADGLSIDADRNVTIEAGATILIGSNTRINVPASSHLIAEGTAQARITIKGKQDNAGYWKGIRVYSRTPGTKFNYCDISGGGSGSEYYKCILYMYSGSFTSSYMELNNTIFSKSLHYGLYLENYNATSYCLVASSNPSSVTFSSCSAGNIYSNCANGNNFVVYSDLSSSCNLQ
jgi:hypothetical protein